MIKIIIYIVLADIAIAIIRILISLIRDGSANFFSRFDEKDLPEYYKRENRKKSKELPGLGKWNRPEPAPIQMIFE